VRDEDRGKRLIAAFLLGMVLLNFPLLAVVEAGERLFGLPPLFVYLFGAWASLIGLLCLIVERKGQR
jgi:Co/Zn/Cd efflux system component